jgi:hypothetical protein
MKMKLTALLITVVIALASPPSLAQDDALVLHCKTQSSTGKELLTTIRINKTDGTWEEWDDDRQDFGGMCPFESDTTKATCMKSNAWFGYEQTARSQDGTVTTRSSTISRESGRYQRTVRATFTAKDLLDLGLRAQPDAEVVEAGMCDPGEAPRPRATRF